MEEAEQPIFPQSRCYIKDGEMIAMMLNLAIGTGWMKLGLGWRCGIFLSGIITIIFALLSYYAIWMYIKTVELTRRGSLEQINEVLFNKFSSKIIFVFSTVTTVSGIMFNIQFIIDYLLTVIKTVWPGIPTYLDDYNVFGGIITFILYIPLSSISKLHTIAILSYIKLSCIAFIVIGIIWNAYTTIKSNGFDPNGQLKFASFDEYAISCINSLLVAYLIVPLAWPSPQHVKFATKKSLLRIFKIIFGFLCMFYLCVGLIAYFTFFDSNEGDLLLNLYSNSIFTNMMKVAMIISLILSFPVLFSHGRMLLIYAIVGYPKLNNSYISVFVGFPLTIASYALGMIKGKLFDLICLISDTSNPVLLFIIPSVLYLKGFGFSQWYHGVGAILNIIVGICGVGLIWYGYLG